jgi:serine/threonine protein kinase
MALPNVGDTVLRKYTLTKTLGRGSFGTVYAARDNSTGTDVAVKVLKVPPGNDATAIARRDQFNKAFDEEVVSFTRLSHVPSCHPNIVCMYGKDKHSVRGLVFIITELMDGDMDGPALPEDQRIIFMRDTLAGLAFIHSHNSAHLDIKPANILRKGNQYKLGDLGLVCHINPLVRQCMVQGSPLYMAPEFYDPVSPHRILLGQGISLAEAQSSDIWSLGLTFYQLLSRIPQRSVPHVYSAAGRNPLPRLHLLSGSGLVPAATINEIVNSMLQDYGGRPTAQTLLDRVNVALESCVYNGNRLSKPETMTALTSLNVVFDPNASTHLLCQLLRANAPCIIKANNLSAPDLKVVAQVFGLPDGGTKTELCGRLKSALIQQDIIDKAAFSRKFDTLLIEYSLLKSKEPANPRVKEYAKLLKTLVSIAPDKFDKAYFAGRYVTDTEWIKQMSAKPNKTPDDQERLAAAQRYIRALNDLAPNVR